MAYLAAGIVGISPQESVQNKLPPSMQGLYLLDQFRKAQNQSDYMAASIRWSQVRPQLQKYEVACSDAAGSGEKDIVISALEDVTKAPLGIIISLAQVALSFHGQDRDNFLTAVKDTFEEAIALGAGKGAEKLTEPARRALEKSLERLREALLQYLQSVSKRSRKHFISLIDSVIGTLRGLGGAVALTVKLIAQPTQIAPEWCGLLREIEAAQCDAFSRIFPAMPRQPLVMH